MNKSPAFQFYPADWLNDMKLQSLPLSSIGLLINLMCVMHQSEKYGYLQENGVPFSGYSLAKFLRMEGKTLENNLEKLLSKGVLKKDSNGTIYCYRMVEDNRLREIRKEAGKLGGNPNLVNQTDKQKPTPSSSSSSSSSKEDIYIPIFDHWNTKKIIQHEKLTDKMKTAIRSALKDHTQKEILEAIDNYATVLQGKLYFYSYKFTIKDFLNRSLERFLSSADPLYNYLKNTGKRKGKTTTDTRTPTEKRIDSLKNSIQLLTDMKEGGNLSEEVEELLKDDLAELSQLEQQARSP